MPRCDVPRLARVLRPCRMSLKSWRGVAGGGHSQGRDCGGAGFEKGVLSCC